MHLPLHFSEFGGLIYANEEDRGSEVFFVWVHLISFVDVAWLESSWRPPSRY
jgi:hypothetical protein